MQNSCAMPRRTKHKLNRLLDLAKIEAGKLLLNIADLAGRGKSIMQQGFDDILFKPITHKALLEILTLSATT